MHTTEIDSERSLLNEIGKEKSKIMVNWRVKGIKQFETNFTFENTEKVKLTNSKKTHFTLRLLVMNWVLCVITLLLNLQIHAFLRHSNIARNIKFLFSYSLLPPTLFIPLYHSLSLTLSHACSLSLSHFLYNSFKKEFVLLKMFFNYQILFFYKFIIYINDKRISFIWNSKIKCKIFQSMRQNDFFFSDLMYFVEHCITVDEKIEIFKWLL